MNDLEIARALEEEILGGEPFNYPCGCFGKITKVCKWNANWVHVYLIQTNCGEPTEHYPVGTMFGWRTRSGACITTSEWQEQVVMVEYVYGRG